MSVKTAEAVRTKDASNKKHQTPKLAQISKSYFPNNTPDGFTLFRKSSCSCGGGCPRCAGESHQPNIQPKLTVSTPGDQYEQEADHVAEQLMRMPDPILQRQCKGCTEESARSPNDEEEPQIRRQANGEAGTSQVASHFANRLGTGVPLDKASRGYFEQRFGHDFGNVRIHNGPQAYIAAASIQARAFTFGRDVVFSAAEYDPSSDRGKRLLAHELTHVVQQSGSDGNHVGERGLTSNSLAARRKERSDLVIDPVIEDVPHSVPGQRILAHEHAHIAAGHTAASPPIVFREEDPAAVLPTQAQRDQILDIFNPQQSAGTTPEVNDPVAFKNELVAIGETLRLASMPAAVAVRDASVVLSETDLTDVTPIAEEEVRRAVGSALSAGVDLTAVRNRIRYIPTDPGTSPASGEATFTADQLAGLDRSAVRIKIAQSADARAVITNHHVLIGGRDRELFNEALQAIVDSAPAAWRTIALTFRGWNTSVATLLQRRIVPNSGESEEQARRRGRWLNLGTSIHEMLHAVTHPDFNTAIRQLEQSDLGVEGFTEFFTRRIYADIASRAASDAVLRLRIEGTAGPAFTPPPRTSYSDFFATVTDIFHLLGDNIENMQKAYFSGQVEFLGLGSWNALAHGLPVHRGNEIGVAVLFEAAGGSLVPGRALVRAGYGRLIWGYSGSVQVDLRAGGGLTYLSEGQRLGIGPQASLTLRGSHLFLEGGALLEGTVAASGPATPRIDALLRISAGVQIGRLQVGPSLEVLFPVTDRPLAERGTRVFGGLGASFVFGR